MDGIAKSTSSSPPSSNFPVIASTVAAIALMAVLLGSTIFIGCGDSKPATFSLQEPIPFGDTTLTISQVEEYGQLPAYLGAKHGVSHVAVFFICKGLGDVLREEKVAPKSLLGLFTLSIVTDEGKKYSTPALLPQREFRMMQSGSDPEQLLSIMQGEQFGASDDWVALFPLPEQSRGLKLRISNPWPKSGQPSLAEVPLGR